MRVKPGCRRTDAADAMCSAMPFHNLQPFEAVSDVRGGKKLAYGDESSRLHSWSLSLPFLPSLLAGISVCARHLGVCSASLLEKVRLACLQNPTF